MTLLALSSCRNGGSIVYVESFRKKGISDDRIISNAIAAAGESGMVFFAPGRTYLITNAILVKKFQVLVGNNSTLLRANQTFTRLMSAAGDTDRDLRLEHIPEGWQIGDQLQVLLDSTGGHCTAFGDLPRLPQIIEKIFEIVQQINREGKTVLLVEQNALQALQIAHQGVVLETGKVVTRGPARELLASDEVRKAYLGE